MQTDPLADFLTQIRNANTAGKTEVRAPHSGMKESVARVLKAEGFIQDCKVETVDKTKKVIVLELKDTKNSKVITTIRRVSKPGLRKYVASSEIPKVLGGMGISILSTSRGVMSGLEAKKQNVGGELLAYVW